MVPELGFSPILSCSFFLFRVILIRHEGQKCTASVAVMWPCCFVLKCSCFEGCNKFKCIKQECILNLEVKSSNSCSSQTFRTSVGDEANLFISSSFTLSFASPLSSFASLFCPINSNLSKHARSKLCPSPSMAKQDRWLLGRLPGRISGPLYVCVQYL